MAPPEKAPGKHKQTALSDSEDKPYSVISLSTESESESSVCSDGIPVGEVHLFISFISSLFLTHFQLVAMLPSKTKPLKARRSKAKLKLKSSTTHTKHGKKLLHAIDKAALAAILHNHNNKYNNITDDALEGGGVAGPSIAG